MEHFAVIDSELVWHGVGIQLNKGEMIYDIVRLINDEVITLDELKDFSHELKEEVKRLLKGSSFSFVQNNED